MGHLAALPDVTLPQRSTAAGSGKKQALSGAAGASGRRGAAGQPQQQSTPSAADNDDTVVTPALPTHTQLNLLYTNLDNLDVSYWASLVVFCAAWCSFHALTHRHKFTGTEDSNADTHTYIGTATYTDACTDTHTSATHSCSWSGRPAGFYGCPFVLCRRKRGWA